MTTELTSLRQQASASYRWRNKAGRVVTQQQLDAMDEKERAKYQWKSDPKVIEALVALERQQFAQMVGAA